MLFADPLAEDNPFCQYENDTSTVFVSQYPWDDQFTPVSDSCTVSTKDVCANEVSDPTIPTYGAPLQCYFDEDISTVCECVCE